MMQTLDHRVHHHVALSSGRKDRGDAHGIVRYRPKRVFGNTLNGVSGIEESYWRLQKHLWMYLDDSKERNKDIGVGAIDLAGRVAESLGAGDLCLAYPSSPDP